MNDGATKIFLSTKGTANDVTPDVKAFLNYIDGVIGEDNFVSEVDNAVKNLKKKESERVSYMTYAMKMLEEREEGREAGRDEGRAELVRNWMKAKNVTADEAMKTLLIPEDIQEKIRVMI